MKISGNNVFVRGSKIPVSLVVENLDPTIDITSLSAELKVKFYCLDEHDQLSRQMKTQILSLSTDKAKFVETEGYNTFAAVVDTALLDTGRLAGEMSWKMLDPCTSLPLEPIIPFLTDYIIKPQ